MSLPFWQDVGWQRARPLAYEHLGLDGQANPAVPLRVRTQARQIYVFARAERLGLVRGAKTWIEPVLRGFARHALAPDGQPGWVHVLGADGRVLDDRRDLYDHAFLLLMLGEVRALAATAESEATLATTVATLDTLFRASGGGYAETARGELPRRQNPHMHLFEALLALAEADGDGRWLARAGELFGLLRTRWLDEVDGTLREFFAADWSRLPNGASDVLEPGHHMEWVWLLDRYGRLTGRATGDLQDALFARGEALGCVAEAQGFLADVVDPAGRPLQDSRRLWPQTEYLRALVVQARRHRSEALFARAEAVSDALFRSYLAGAPAGTWCDRFTLAGAPAVDHIPASILYHLFGVYSELAAGVRADS